MAIFGLQKDFMNGLLSQYFGITKPDLTEKELFLGLGLTQHGATVNMEQFDEVFSGKNEGNYQRARIIFGKAENEMISNINTITFPTASEDWTTEQDMIVMLGIFDTIDYLNTTANELVKPLVVLPLINPITVETGETIILSPNTINLALTDI